MTENEMIKILRNNFPKTCKTVDGKRKGGFDDTECEFGKALLLAISALEEIQQYRAIGTVEEIEELNFSSNQLRLVNLVEEYKEKLKDYEAIGTVEECREAREMQKPKKPNKRQLGNTLVRKIYHCPNCNKRLYDCAFKNGKLDHVSPGSRKSKFCEDCGQKLDWSE